MREIPGEYRQNAMIGFFQDLNNIHVYWDFTPERIATLQNYLRNVRPDMKFVLRLYSIDSDCPEREITIDILEQSSYYFKNLDPKNAYHLEMGTVCSNGEYVTITRSPEITLLPGEVKAAAAGEPRANEQPPQRMPEQYPPASTFGWS